jgi:adenine-specific DNA-methyltransferase
MNTVRLGNLFAEYDLIARTLVEPHVLSNGALYPFEKNGVVYTKPWVVELILDLAGYCEDRDLASLFAVEPAAGDGAFLVPMAKRLIHSCHIHNRPITDCIGALLAYEIEDISAAAARQSIESILVEAGASSAQVSEIACSWVRTGDYLLDAPELPLADFVIGNPPYIRLEDINPALAATYRDQYPTMTGRADIYIAFYEAALAQLKRTGVCAFICADRWMLNQYGTELRKLVTNGYSVEAVIEMHKADAFDLDVSAYPAITIIRRGPQTAAVVASADPNAENNEGGSLSLAK